MSRGQQAGGTHRAKQAGDLPAVRLRAAGWPVSWARCWHCPAHVTPHSGPTPWYQATCATASTLQDRPQAWRAQTAPQVADHQKREEGVWKRARLEERRGRLRGIRDKASCCRLYWKLEAVEEGSGRRDTQNNKSYCSPVTGRQAGRQAAENIHLGVCPRVRQLWGSHFHWKGRGPA